MKHSFWDWGSGCVHRCMRCVCPSHSEGVNEECMRLNKGPFTARFGLISVDEIVCSVLIL